MSTRVSFYTQTKKIFPAGNEGSARNIGSLQTVPLAITSIFYSVPLVFI
jgi:hypothetical protein